MESVAFDGSRPAVEVGYYTYTAADGAWFWSPGVYAMHGFEPREVPATTDVLLRHKHPEDRARAFSVLETALQDGQPFSCYHRIIDRHERVRSVLSVGRGIKDAEGKVERLEGYLVDLTSARRSETEAEVETALAKIAEHRAVIEQAKGMVMLSEHCDAEAAFAVLRTTSQHANIKLHEVAQRLVAAAASRLPRGKKVRQLLDELT